MCVRVHPRVGAGSDAVSNAKSLSPEARHRLQRFAKERVELAQQSLQEFLQGFAEGKQEELARQAAEALEEARAQDAAAGAVRHAKGPAAAAPRPPGGDCGPGGDGPQPPVPQ